MADIPSYPLFNRTYHLYRLSPLYHGDTPLLDAKSLRTHAKRLREQLKGDNVRGVEVDFAGTEGALPNLGPLDECSWELMGDEDAWIDRHRHLLEPDASQLSSAVAPDQARGIEVTLEYEKQSYNALILRDPETTSSLDHFTSLPLLLVKMPAPIREIFLNYLKTTFDAHVVSMKLPSAFLTSSLDTYLQHLSSDGSTQSITDVIRQLQLQLTFPTSTTLLKHIDLTIAGDDVPGFLNRGKLLPTSLHKPFTSAISSYINKHLAIDLSNPKVQISKISCSAFTVSTDRLRIVAPDIQSDTSSSGAGDPPASSAQLAVQDFFVSLVREATGSGKFLPEDITAEKRSSTPSSTAIRRVGSRKRAVSNAAAGNTTKRTKAKGKENSTHPDGNQAMLDELV
ncbi:kinetochore complex Sim4 subunit Fta1-domain-containing protein [Massariosphaeria phaeospora]|uniref:Kinetochore complex Sim4 subunit Fta1-domain-containing protein n=1 Tax=Massariosphaeria phaeospora TaxID=100035 RepID=A0A7C8M8U8_9PLEO|nr:kinetochore complex Sim4 subunit Fta1-domain-containing protein [Massariosphaeria phaeospora]